MSSPTAYHTTRCRVAAASLFAALVIAAPLAGQGTGVQGRVENQAGAGVQDAFVLLRGTDRGNGTDGEGRFRILGVEPGTYRLVVSHIAYGERSVELVIETGVVKTVRVVLSDTAIVLEPIAVEALSREERAARGAGYRRSVVTREQLAIVEGTNMTLADVMRSYMPSVRVRNASNLVGSPTCIELRTVRATFRNDCLSPAVYLDGVPITNPTTLFNNLDPNIIESVESIPAAEAGARFGTGALFGAILIETRRPGVDREEGFRIPPANRPNFDWSTEPTGHPSSRSFLFSFLGNAAGLAIGLAAANECIGTRQPANDRIIALCDSGPTALSATAALVLPSLGGALGAHFGGATDGSRGRFLPALIGGAMALLPAYGLIFSGERMDSDVLRGLGAGVMIIGVPTLSTIADHQFRYPREPR